MMPLLRRLRALPYVLFLSMMAVLVVWGDGGLLAWQEMQRTVDLKRDAWVRASAENDALLLRLRALDRDPMVLERELATRQGLAPEGAVLYEFTAEQP